MVDTNSERTLTCSSSQRNATCPDLYASERVYTLSANSEEDTKRFGMLVEEINASYCEIDEIFEMNGIAGSHTEPRRGSHMRENKHGRYVDMFSSDVLPFPLKNTAEVVWHFYSGSTKHRGPIYYKDAQVCSLLVHSSILRFKTPSNFIMC